MPKNEFGAFAKRITLPDLRISPTEGMSLDRLRIEFLAGLTTSLALVPEVVAFAFVLGVNPVNGLYGAVFLCLITAILGGRPGVISGAAGSTAVVLVSLVAKYGIEYLFATVILAGIIQIFVGLMRWGKFIRLVPHPVMLGFVNGLAIIILMAQLEQFHLPGTAHDPGPTQWITGPTLWIMIGLVVLTMGVTHLMPRLTKLVPAPLAAIIVTAALVLIFGLNVPDVGDMAHLKGVLPSFHVPMVPFTFETLKIILPYAVIMAAVGLIESLLTLNLVGEITGQRGGASQDCVAQGTANIFAGAFTGMGGCAMIGQSMINIRSGGRTRIAGVVAALFVLSYILVASQLIELIPLAALVGVMLIVVIETFAWNSFKIMAKAPRMDAAVIVIVTVVTVLTDLATAVVIGVIISALAYAWNNARRIHASTETDESGAKIYKIHGPLFFGSTDGFAELFRVNEDPERVIVDFDDSRVVDQSALQAIESLAEKYQAAGKELQLRHLSPDCHRLLTRAGSLVVESDNDPGYGLAVDYKVRTGS
ncbi:SulP family inorganic anion transporter [Pseudooceanicola sp. CBS1P-1]|uniref:STAS domain-containing protein n=1 Tax=Pseudooceanicola albus TaxID=2692189 RepID=A0A6L7G3L5_9RHOB|nr:MULTISPECIES: SulP family inorganic anion transporter [Pseudooceanicola]MBT9382674.1 SulP family inorganic anion transporter [Pseudooceanicola endophyticus]MXN17213.1 STAS domain-containing protein [Pseudooceanicola albus]